MFAKQIAASALFLVYYTLRPFNDCLRELVQSFYELLNIFSISVVNFKAHFRCCFY